MARKPRVEFGIGGAQRLIRQKRLPSNVRIYIETINATVLRCIRFMQISQTTLLYGIIDKFTRVTAQITTASKVHESH